jgi:1-acyl-sn-glycerol-3-phosphate acyltransferase
LNDSIPAPQPPTASRRWAYRLLALFGWKVDVHWPPVPRCVIIVYPHTSNWDFVVGIVARYAIALPVQWVAKDALFRGPFGPLFRRWGGIPVNRREPAGFVSQLAEEFRRRAWMWVAITPEGTRSHASHWKSGFYRLALDAGVPVGLAYIDYARKTVGLTTYLDLTGDPQRDLDAIRAFYADKTALRPDKAGAIRFRDDAARQPAPDR